MSDASVPLGARLNYAQCWEDWRMVAEALRAGEGRRLLSIASAGDNALALALAGAEVVAIDLSPPQIALTELKIAGHRLTLPETRALLGIDPHPDRLRLYRAVRSALDGESRAYWDARTALIEKGIAFNGRFEAYLERFRLQVLPLVHRRRTVLGWFDLPDVAAQRDYFERRWDNRRWRALFRVFFSRRVMAALGRSPEQFAHVEGSIGDRLLARARRVLTEVPVRDNGYLQLMLAGAYLFKEALPPYLTETGHAALGEASRRIRLVRAPLDRFLIGEEKGSYDGFNLSDIFEYLAPGPTERLLSALADAGRTGARLAYWNLFVPRSRPESLSHRLVPQRALADRLFARDRAFVYGAFHVEEIA